MYIMTAYGFPSQRGGTIERPLIEKYVTQGKSITILLKCMRLYRYLENKI